MPCLARAAGPWLQAGYSLPKCSMSPGFRNSRLNLPSVSSSSFTIFKESGVKESLGLSERFQVKPPETQLSRNNNPTSTCSHCSVNWRSLLLQLATLSGFFAFSALAWASGGSEIARAQDSLTFGLEEIKEGFTSAFLLIFFSELGDKTFFIAAILASRKSNFAVFTGTFGALVAMTLISVTLGRAFHYIDGILPFSLGNTEIPVDDLAAVILLIYFGVSTLVDAASMEGSKAEEEQQEAELAVAGVNGGSNTVGNVVVATFALVFVAEWGDKSFFSTIALAAASSPVGVVSGAIVGHCVATVLAVLGGSFLGNYISEKAIAYIGGTLFLVFAADTLFEIFNGGK